MAKLKRWPQGYAKRFGRAARSSVLAGSDYGPGIYGRNSPGPCHRMQQTGDSDA
jgi:hypothetical protein